MSLCSTKYDPDATLNEIKSKTIEASYPLFEGKVDHPNVCKDYNVLNSRSNVHQSSILNRTDIESRLQNRHVPLNNYINQFKIKEHKNFNKSLDSYPNCEDTEDYNKNIFDDIPFSINSKNQGHNFKSYYNQTLISHPKSMYRGLDSSKKVILPYLTNDKQKLLSTGEKKFYDHQQDFRFMKPTNTRNILRNKYQNDLSKKYPNKYPQVNKCLINGDCSKISKKH